MMIRFCLSLAIKSPSAYDAFQNVLYLPSRRRLRDYKTVIRPQAGFSPQVINELKSQTKAFWITFDRWASELDPCSPYSNSNSSTISNRTRITELDLTKIHRAR